MVVVCLPASLTLSTLCCERGGAALKGPGVPPTEPGDRVSSLPVPCRSDIHPSESSLHWHTASAGISPIDTFRKWEPIKRGGQTERAHTQNPVPRDE
ncbi:Uncharacterized protein APZ42_021800 [Daphnia magna]|uniref:Secreted protein n=1 Tax=Daphnia magna TaxID=35525 RepID=A0A164WC72_9CRUS|nr:Uncharacterized protein APZ42_021800 [Daphnia magna]